MVRGGPYVMLLQPKFDLITMVSSKYEILCRIEL
jgi:hypothetical protein